MDVVAGDEGVDGPDSLADRHPDLRWVYNRFQENLDALREMATEYVPQVEKRDQERLTTEGITRHVRDPEQRLRLVGYLNQLLDDARDGEPVGFTIGGDLEDGENAQILAEVFDGDRQSMVSWVQRFLRSAYSPSRTSIMRNSLLTQAIAGFEVLVAGVAAQHYVLHPAALESSEKQFTFADLKSFETVSDAADHRLSAELDTLMRGDLEDWRKWFTRACSADISTMAIDWDVLAEAFQRRHIVVHNGGRVSRRYLSKIPSSIAKPELNARVDSGDEYVQRVLDEVDVVGTTLALSAWGTWVPDDRETTAGLLLQRSYDAMCEGRWEVARKLTETGKQLRCSRATLQALKVNHWISVLEIDGASAIRTEVTAWDVSADAGRFRLARLVLLEDYDEALTLARSLYQAKEIERGHILEWPLLRRFREHPEFDIDIVAPKRGKPRELPGGSSEGNHGLLGS